MKREIGVLVVLILVASAISMLSSGQPISPSQPPPGPEVYDLVVTAEPSAIPADGESTSTIIATVTNYSESPDGYTICFEIVGNSYGARISDKCDSTDEYGKAYTTLIAGETPGTVTVEACWSEYGRKVCNTTNVTLTGVPKIVSWYNNITGDDLEITVRDTQMIYFNATADQPIDKWHWFKDDSEVDWNHPYFITSWPENTHGTHHVKVRAENENGTSSPVIWTINVEDKTPPPEVTGLNAEILNATAVRLTWDESPAPDLDHYCVYKDYVLLENTSDNLCIVTGLLPGAEYVFEVSAADIHGNEGERSDVIVQMPSPPNITLWYPSEEVVTDKEGDSRAFGIKVDQTVYVEWLINGTVVKSESDVKVSTYGNESAVVGVWNVTVVVTNVSTDLSDMHSWTWVVEPVARGVSLTVDGGEYAESVVAPGENATYVLTLENTGEREDTFTIAVENVDNADVAVLDRYEVSLPPENSTKITLTVGDADEGDYVVNVTAVSLNDTGVRDSVTTLTKVRAPKPDLIVSIALNCGHLFANETNNITVTIENEGAADAGAFNVSVDISGTVKKERVEGLNAGESVSLNIVDDEMRYSGETVEIVAVVDCDNDIEELNETNNELSISETVVNNGYKGKRYTGGEDISTWKTFALNGSVLYSIGDSRYQSGDGWTAYTVNWSASDLPVPASATVKEARLFVYYTWDKDNVMPYDISMKFNGETIEFDRHYTDRKGYGSYDYPYGMLAYNVTDAFNRNGNTATLTKYDGYVAIKGMLLVVVYADMSEPFREIVMNEGFDMLYGGAEKCTTPEEATAYAPFAYSIDDIGNKSAKLIAVAPGAGYPDGREGDLIFNEHLWKDVWTCAGSSQIGIAVRDVTAYLSEMENNAAFRSSEDYMEASNAILVVETRATGSIVGRITYACNGTGIAGVTVNLTRDGSVVASTTTDSNGNYTFTDVILGDYYVNASKRGFWDNSTAVTVSAGGTETVNMMLWLKGDLNNNGIPADIGDVAMMWSAWKGEITADYRYDLNNNGIPADIGDVAMMWSAWKGEIVLNGGE